MQELSGETRAILNSFQDRNADWMAQAFRDDPTDLAERVARFGEEALELQQALRQSRADAHALVDYVYDRPVGEPAQEMGGTLTTLACLAAIAGLDMAECGERELARCWTKPVLAKIRGKRANRSGRGALPGIGPVPISDIAAGAGSDDDADWRDDPSADDRWNAGLDYGMQQLCAVLGVDPAIVNWDAATETLDGDVQSVMCGIFEKWGGEDWQDAALTTPPVQAETAGDRTDALVDRFADALKAKLRQSEDKQGWRDGQPSAWRRDDWQQDCQTSLARHVWKGDPIDVAAFAAFCWHHGWPTYAPRIHGEGKTENVAPTPAGEAAYQARYPGAPLSDCEDWAVIAWNQVAEAALAAHRNGAQAGAEEGAHGTISGPYHYAHELRPCFRVDGPNGYVGSITIHDDDEDTAYALAEALAAAVRPAAPSGTGNGEGA